MEVRILPGRLPVERETLLHETERGRAVDLLQQYPVRVDLMDFVASAVVHNGVALAHAGRTVVGHPLNVAEDTDVQGRAGRIRPLLGHLLRRGVDGQLERDGT